MAAFSFKAGLSVAVVLSAVFAPSVNAHGWCQRPLARQFCNGKEMMWSVSDSGGNGARGMHPPYGGMPGMCGDPFEAGDHQPISNFQALPCEPQETYQAGSVIPMQIDVAANHGGFWEVSVCDSKEISQDCFDRHKLRTVSHDSEQWWIQDKKIENPNDKRPDSYFMDWKIPESLTCEHCVVQWTWWTAHNCIFECDAAVCGAYADRKNKVVYPQGNWDMRYCDTRYPAKGKEPQIYRNCADIKIVGSGTPTTAPAPAPATANETAPAPAPATANETAPAPAPATAPTAAPAPAPETPKPTTTPSKKQVTNPDETSDGTSKFTEQAACTMSRRFLLNDELLEEEDGIDDISGAGNFMNCGDLLVEQVLVEINKMRKEVHAQPLQCSNRAVGASRNFGNIMADMGYELDDAADNCNLAGFEGRCVQMVATGGTGAPLTTLTGIDHAVLVAPEYSVAGVGYYDVNGVTYWTLLMG